MIVLTADLLRASRALLDMTQKKLSGETGITPKALSDFERGKKPLTTGTSKRLREVFEAHGIQYLAVNSGDSTLDGIGLRWKPREPSIHIKII